ncbi:MAG: hypothetical protein Q7T44_04165 [Parvibaculum sp.]|nr:hypothetical protein [Parvibaculum sp.]
MELKFIRMLGLPSARYPGIEDWLGLDSTTGVILHMEVHYVPLSGIKYVKYLRLPWEKAMSQYECVNDGKM